MNFKSKILAAGLAAVIAGGGIFAANMNAAQAQPAESADVAQLEAQVLQLQQQIAQISALIAQLKSQETCGNGICRFGETAAACPADCQNSNSTTCKTLWWSDNTSKICQQKQFCGTYMYLGLKTYSTQSACQTALDTACSKECVAKGYVLGGNYCVANEYGVLEACCCTGSAAKCGNGTCENSETATNCSADCGGKKATCTDSDNGTNYYKLGRITEINQYSNWTANSYPDMCVTDIAGANLAEAICEKRSDGYYYGSQKYYNCPNGCKDGACAPKLSEIVSQLIPSSADVASCTTNTGEKRPTTGTSNYANWFIWNGCAKEKKYQITSTASSTPQPIVLNVYGDLCASCVCKYPNFSVYALTGDVWIELYTVNISEAGINRNYLYIPGPGTSEIKIVASSCFYLKAYQGSREALTQNFPDLIVLPGL